MSKKQKATFGYYFGFLPYKGGDEGVTITLSVIPIKQDIQFDCYLDFPEVRRVIDYLIVSFGGFLLTDHPASFLMLFDNAGELEDCVYTIHEVMLDNNIDLLNVTDTISAFPSVTYATQQYESILGEGVTLMQVISWMYDLDYLSGELTELYKGAEMPVTCEQQFHPLIATDMSEFKGSMDKYTSRDKYLRVGQQVTLLEDVQASDSYNSFKEAWF